MSRESMSDRLRALLDDPAGLELPGCHDALSAVILARAGFPAVFLSGYGAAASLLGNPDIGLTSLLETAIVAKNVAAAIDVPLVVDADNGYGDEDHVVRTVEELERAGAAGIILEDQVFPKRCGHAAGKAIIPLDRYMRKLACALEARRTSMVVVARTDATCLDEGIARATRFHAAGADVTLVDGLASLEALERVGREVPGRKLVNLIHGGKTPILPSARLHELGFTVVLYSTPALYAAARAMIDAAARLRETGCLGAIAPESLAFPEFQRLVEGGYLARSGHATLGALKAADAPAAAPGPEPAAAAPLPPVRPRAVSAMHP
jgi:2-methylisocitrate lyase-like PEP mutase family enzyme